MRYALYDYHPVVTGTAAEPMVDWWSRHWEGRSGLKRDLTHELVWATIEDVVRSPGRLLEAGCGPGQWVQFLDGQGHIVTGIDYAESGLRVGKRANGCLKLLRGDFRNLPFRAGAFDYILSIGAIEHDVRGPEAALREFRRVLSASGWLMCSVPCLNIERRMLLPWMVLRDWLKCRPALRRFAGKREPFEFYEYLFTPGGYTEILEKCGFEVRALRPYDVPKRSRIGRAVSRLPVNLSRFYNPHMMMAICRLRSQATAATAVPVSR